MTKRMVASFIISLAILTLVSLPASAQVSIDGTIKLDGGRRAIFMTAPAQPFTPAAQPSSKLITIYSTLGTGKDVYSTLSGLGVLGTMTGQPYPEMIANGFRPKADHVVTEVQVGAWYFQGTNVMAVSLNQDNNGVPGKALHTWHFADLPVIWSCCTLQTGKYAKGIPVKKGKVYWVVLSPEKKFQDTWDVVADNFAGKQGRLWANNIGSGWNVGYETLSAIGVFGK